MSGLLFDASAAEDEVVLDTNVFISATFSSGPPSRILSAWIADQFDLADCVVSGDRAAPVELLDHRGRTNSDAAGFDGDNAPGFEVGSILRQRSNAHLRLLRR